MIDCQVGSAKGFLNDRLLEGRWHRGPLRIDYQVPIRQGGFLNYRLAISKSRNRNPNTLETKTKWKTKRKKWKKKRIIDRRVVGLLETTKKETKWLEPGDGGRVESMAGPVDVHHGGQDGPVQRSAAPNQRTQTPIEPRRYVVIDFDRVWSGLIGFHYFVFGFDWVSRLNRVEP